MSDNPYLSIVVPAYNEARRLPQTLDKMADFLGQIGKPYEVLIIVERSTDGTLDIAARFAARAIFSRQTLDGFAFDVEVLLLAQRLGYRIDDHPVEWINSPESKVRILRDSLAMLWDTLRVRRVVEGNIKRE